MWKTGFFATLTAAIVLSFGIASGEGRNRDNGGKAESGAQAEVNQGPGQAKGQRGKGKAERQAKAKAKAERKAAVKAKVASENQAAVAALQSAHNALMAADHDYNGHRHIAADSVAKALDALGAAPAEADSPKRDTMTQANSDAMMQQALAALQGAKIVKHKEAHNHVQHAAKEIEAALKTR
jgi:hypothetical protein